jgi:O-methyltransferase
VRTAVDSNQLRTGALAYRFRRGLGLLVGRLGITDPVIEEEFGDTLRKCQRFSMTSAERLYALYRATQYVLDANVPGDFVECGVWRGGSVMVMAHALLQRQAVDRKIYLYDTFKGSPPPSNADVKRLGMVPASRSWRQRRAGDGSNMDYCTLAEVRRNILSTGFPGDRVILVEGRVEETIPGVVPEKIALLRLDTDWYESTRHELNHLFPVLERRGVLIVDDYGDWTGARAAVDEYFSKTPILLNRVDFTGRIGVKT